VKISLQLFVVMSAVCLLSGCASTKPIAPSQNSDAPATASPTNSTSIPAPSGVTNSVPQNRMLVIDPSSMPVGAGKATLTIGTLQRMGGIYSGDYKVKVFPYFFKNETGRLAICVPDDSLAGLGRGKVVTIIGTATSNGKGGRTRHIDATATPVDINGGKLKLWFMAGKAKMIFEPAYHFAGPVVLAQTAGATP
jgi:hypothetical protein